jgi:hypothetical protein
MEYTKFKKLKEITDEKDMDSLNVGDCFLYGTKTIHQKGEKKVGDAITYYQIIAKKPNGVEYTPIYDYMEDNKGEITNE